jgi:serine/threonine protein phosphatase PrpC
MDLAIDILGRGLDDAGDTPALVDGASRLRAAFTTAHARCTTLEEELRAAFETKLRTYGEDRLGASLAASREVAARCGKPVESFAHFAASITALHIWGGDRITIAQVGLCRGYRFRHGTLEQLLPDHSIASALTARGETLPVDERARLYHLPTRLLGMAQGAVPDVRTEHVEPADRYLLCTDGVWACLEPEEIRAVLSIGAKPAAIAAALVDRVAQRPHATAVVIDVAGLPSN